MASDQEEFQKWQKSQEGYVGKAKKADWWRQRELDKQTQAGAMEYGRPGQGREFNIVGTPEERAAALSGLQIAKVGYGQNIFETGQDIAGIRERLKERSAQADPISEAIRNQKAGQVASAQRSLAAQGVKGGAAAGAVANVARAADADIAASLYGQQRQSIADERSLASNTLAGTVGLMQGGKAEGTQMPEPPQAASWTDSVICTELHRQGIMSTELYRKDAEFGEMLKREYKEVIIGYHVLAKPVVKLMQKSPLFTKLIAPFAMKWARFIANEPTVIGAIIFYVGIPTCAVIGKIKISGEKYVQC